jgi:MoaA/NifB/PqqE/SkfB family radical SAM enzyme
MNNKIEASHKFLTWDIHYKCNYNCTYCFLKSEPESANIEAIYLGKEEWLEIWRRAYQKYGSFNVSVTGGEPFIYPNFIDLISRLTQMHTFEFSTNFSWDVVEFAKKVSPKRVKINTSFHPEFVALQEFLKKIAYLKERNYLVTITIVAYPILIENLPEYHEQIKKSGCPLIIYPYRGPYENRIYPEGYTDKERLALNQFGLGSGTAGVNESLLQLYKLKEESVKEKTEFQNNSKSQRCYMGQRYAKVIPNGEAFRCCAAVNKDWGRLGNLIKGTFVFAGESLICPDVSRCRCYKAMIVGEEEKWRKQWTDVGSLCKMENERKLLEQAKTLRGESDLNAGIEKINEVLGINPKNIEARVLLAEFKLDQKDYVSCSSLLIDILNNYPGSDCGSWIYRTLGRASMELGKKEESSKEKTSLFDQAGQYLNKCLKIANENNNLADRARGYYDAAVFYLLKQDYKIARGHISLALKYEPDNEGFLRLAKEIECEEVKLIISQKSNAEKITLGWDLCYTCNYRCPYCGVWEKESECDLLLDTKQWLEIWDRIFDRYGSCHIFMSGGEPSTHPFFYELVERLAKRHVVDICTNLSWEVDRLISKISSDRLKISPTFHPSQADFEGFFKKAIKIKEYLPNAQVYYVAYSGQQITEMPERSRMMKECGISLIPYPLRGNQVVLNTDEEKRIIREVSPYQGEKIEYQLNKISPHGKLCRAGQHYAVIRVDGSVDRCSQYRSGEVGNFLDKDFRLFDQARPCGKEYCPIESQWIVREHG